MVIANVVLTCGLLLTVVRALYRSDFLRKEREEALRQSEIFNRTINESSPDAVSLLDSDGNVLFSNEAAVRAYGLDDVSPLLGRPWGYRLTRESCKARDAALATAREGSVGAVTYSVTSVAGELRWFESLVSKLEGANGQPNQFIVMSRDITEQKRVEEQVRWTATHDSLTRLPNRALFQEKLDELTDRKRKPDFALLLLDIDDFKQVNDTLGHDAGDALLCTVADRLRSAVRPKDFVARLAGDEFAIILERAGSEAGAAAAAEKIFRSMREPWFHAGRVSDCRVSIGASIAPKHGKELSELLKNADIALYVAKVQQPGQLAVFHPQMRAEMQRRSSQITMARNALQENLVVPFYQPKVELTSGKLIGFEALLRWRHPTRGIQLPASIGAAFEDLELAREITGRILGHALADMRHWLDAGVEFGHVALNVAAADFKQRDFAERLLDQVNTHSIPAHCLQVEVTETVFLGRGAEYVEHALKILSASGIRIALDDFGTGYASLSHLKQFPVDIVKIDRSFLRDVFEDSHNSAIIRTVVSLGRSLDLDVVAEGVETKEQEAYLIGQGCRFGQGYLYGKAAPASAIPNLITCWPKRIARAA
ncbi:MAG TPA: EAL domain-containing protein [Allosphingosinicella sp.]|nr:EAL domain-containing protein [Allosphingosinicella sp.]